MIKNIYVYATTDKSYEMHILNYHLFEKIVNDTDRVDDVWPSKRNLIKNLADSEDALLFDLQRVEHGN